MIERLGEPISDEVREIPDIDRNGRRCMGGGVPCGAIEWERARGDRESVKHRKHNAAGL